MNKNKNLILLRQNKKKFDYSNKICELDDIKDKQIINLPEFKFIDHKSVFIDEKILTGMRETKYTTKLLKSYREKDFNNLFEINNQSVLYKLNNVLVTFEGYVFYENTIYKTHLQPAELFYKTDFGNLPFVDIVRPTNPVQYDKVILLSGRYGKTTYHIIYDYMLRLHVFKLLKIDIDEYYIHVNKKTPYVLSICKLFGLNENKIIEGEIDCKELLIPDKCLLDEFDYYHSVIWARQYLLNNISKKERNKRKKEVTLADESINGKSVSYYSFFTGPDR
jgi:hypothetical protein